MEKISDRIRKIIDNENLSVRNFELRIGCSNGVIAKSIKNGTDINSIWLSKIIEMFSKYDPRWIMTGLGEMLSDNEKISAPQDNNYPGTNLLIDKIISLAAENERLKQEIQLTRRKKDYPNDFHSDVAAEP